jgi:hypothetical protein
MKLEKGKREMKFYINSNPQPTGEHEIHRENCSHLPNVENMVFIGNDIMGTSPMMQMHLAIGGTTKSQKDQIRPIFKKNDQSRKFSLGNYHDTCEIDFCYYCCNEWHKK